MDVAPVSNFKSLAQGKQTGLIGKISSAASNSLDLLSWTHGTLRGPASRIAVMARLAHEYELAQSSQLRPFGEATEQLHGLAFRRAIAFALFLAAFYLLEHWARSHGRNCRGTCYGGD